MQPIKELILAELVSLINTIRVAAGYETNLTAEEWTEEGNNLGDKTVLVELGEQREAEAPLLHDGYWQPFTLLCTVAPDPSGATKPDRLLARIEADIRKALFTDTNYQLGGRVQDIDWKGSTNVDANGLPGRLITIEALYYTLAGNPYAQ